MTENERGDKNFYMWNWIKRKLDIGNHSWISTISVRQHEDRIKLERRIDVLEDIVDDLIYEQGASSEEAWKYYRNRHYRRKNAS